MGYIHKSALRSFRRTSVVVLDVGIFCLSNIPMKKKDNDGVSSVLALVLVGGEYS